MSDDTERGRSGAAAMSPRAGDINGLDVTPAGTVAAMLRARADDDSWGLLFEDERWTWREVVRECQARAALLTRLRRPGPFHVGVLLENTPEHLFLLGGAALAGAAVVGINPTRRGEELASDVRHTDCQVVITSSDQSPIIEGLDLGVGADRILVCDTPAYAGQLDAARDTSLPDPGPDADTLFMLMFTSGSTGAPKAVRMTQGRAARTASRSAFQPGDVLYCAMPLFHGHALNASVLPAFATGATLLLRRRFSASGFLPDVRKYGATFFSTVGRALAFILATPPTPHDRDHRLKYVLAPESSAPDIRAFSERFGVPVIEGYGSSENAVIIVPVPGTPAGAMGKPMPGSDVAVVDPATGKERPPARFDADGRLLNADECIGEIVGRNTVSLFEGYYNNPEADAARTRNGWYWTGDLAYRDEDGYFWFAGRSGDWIRVDGENFTPAPIERILGRMPGVAGIAVYAVPDPRTSDQVMATIELEPGATFDPDAFAEFLRAQRDLGTKWAPRFVRVTERLPLTGTNKVDKKPLRAQAWETTDPVWWRPAREDRYRPFTAADAAALRAEFAANRREHLLGTLR
jgi:fatty-acyl-CoA synthase